MAEFRDATGRPGPSTWELGTYPDGQDGPPGRRRQLVRGGGVRALRRQGCCRRFITGDVRPRSACIRDILRVEQLRRQGAAPVGEFKGIAPFGAYDMAGNVKEWCWNEVGRSSLHSWWRVERAELSVPRRGCPFPFDRSPQNGIRTIKPADAAPLPEVALRPVEQLQRDYRWRSLSVMSCFAPTRACYSYDRTDLAPAMESVERKFAGLARRTHHLCRRIRRRTVPAYLFLPKHATPPYQTVVYYPHGASRLTSFIRAGRDVLPRDLW